MDALLPYIFASSSYLSDIYDMLDAVDYYSFPRVTAPLSLSWMSMPPRLASPDAVKQAAVAECVQEVLLDCEYVFTGDMNVLLPTDTREEFARNLAKLGQDMGAGKRLDMKLSPVLYQLELDGIVEEGSSGVKGPYTSVLAFLVAQAKEVLSHDRKYGQRR